HDLHLRKVHHRNLIRRRNRNQQRLPIRRRSRAISHPRQFHPLRHRIRLCIDHRQPRLRRVRRKHPAVILRNRNPLHLARHRNHRNRLPPHHIQHRHAPRPHIRRIPARPIARQHQHVRLLRSRRHLAHNLPRPRVDHRHRIIQLRRYVQQMPLRIQHRQMRPHAMPEINMSHHRMCRHIDHQHLVPIDPRLAHTRASIDRQIRHAPIRRRHHLMPMHARRLLLNRRNLLPTRRIDHAQRRIALVRHQQRLRPRPHTHHHHTHNRRNLRSLHNATHYPAPPQSRVPHPRSPQLRVPHPRSPQLRVPHPRRGLIATGWVVVRGSERYNDWIKTEPAENLNAAFHESSESPPSFAPAISLSLHPSADSTCAPPAPPADTPYPPPSPRHHARTHIPCRSRAPSSTLSAHSSATAAPAPRASPQCPRAPRHTPCTAHSTSTRALNKPPPRPALNRPPATPGSAPHRAHSNKDSTPQAPPARCPPPPS